MVNWVNNDQRIPIGDNQWNWAPQGIGAAFVIDLRHEPSIGRYLMFFQAGTGFKEHVNIGIAWSNDLESWSWPGI
jgi:hypothetical protein